MDGRASSRRRGHVRPPLILVLLKKGGEVNASSLQLTVGPSCNHLALKKQQQKNKDKVSVII